MSAEGIALLAAVIAAIQLAGTWWISSRRGAHDQGTSEANIIALAGTVERLGADSRLAWGTLRQDLEAARLQLGAEIDELRRDLHARDHRLYDRFDTLSGRVAGVEARASTLEAQQEKDEAAIAQLQATLRSNGRGL